MGIQPIVEGYGEVAAVPILLRRLAEAFEIYNISIKHPIRWPRTKLLKEEEIRRVVQLARRHEDCEGIVYIIDAHDDCPAKVIQNITTWVKDEATPLPCGLVLATKEYEAWFLASLESLRGERGIPSDAMPPDNPESISNAKGYLKNLMAIETSYSETVDQAQLSAKFDLKRAFERSRSFRKLTNDFRYVLSMMKFPLTNPCWFR